MQRFRRASELRNDLVASLHKYREEQQRGRITDFAKESFDPATSFARPTGLPRIYCHSAITALRPLGRTFKLHGYTMTGIQTISSKTGSTTAGRSFDKRP